MSDPFSIWVRFQIYITVADPVGLRRGVHRLIVLGEAQSDKGIGMGGGIPLSLVGVWGTSPKKISENKAHLVNFGGISMHAWYNFGAPGSILTN